MQREPAPATTTKSAACEWSAIARSVPSDRPPSVCRSLRRRQTSDRFLQSARAALSGRGCLRLRRRCEYVSISMRNAALRGRCATSRVPPSGLLRRPHGEHHGQVQISRLSRSATLRAIDRRRRLCFGHLRGPKRNGSADSYIRTRDDRPRDGGIGNTGACFALSDTPSPQRVGRSAISAAPNLCGSHPVICDVLGGRPPMESRHASCLITP